VHVSIVNWRAGGDDTRPVLDGVEVESIGPDLRARIDGAWTPQTLAANSGRCFEGPSPKAKGLLVSEDVASSLLADTSVDYGEVVRPYLTAADIADDPAQGASRWCLDFGLRPLEEAMRYPRALAICRELVRPEREKNRRKAYREKWWQFAEPRRARRDAIGPLRRYVVGGRHGKRLNVAWSPTRTVASDATNSFAFDDDFSMGVLQSRAHVAWAWFQSSTLKGDLRYTPSSVFMTFAWPDRATEAQRDTVADVCRRLLAHRAELCERDQIGLTKLYNAMDDGAYTELAALHRELDVAVADCYGWPSSVAQDDDEIVRRLTELNREISEGEREYRPFD